MLRTARGLTYILLHPIRMAVCQRLCREPREAVAAFVGRSSAVITRGFPVVLVGAVFALLTVQEGIFPVAECAHFAIGVKLTPGELQNISR